MACVWPMCVDYIKKLAFVNRAGGPGAFRVDKHAVPSGMDRLKLVRLPTASRDGADGYPMTA